MSKLYSVKANKENTALNILRMCFAFTLLFCLFGCHPAEKPLFLAPHKAPPPKPLNNINVALALGVGGFRGMAHLGVIEVLEKEGVPIDLIVGSSAGSLIGSFYSDTPNTLLIKPKVLAMNRKDLVSSSRPPIKGYVLQRYLYCNLRAKNFEELQIPLVAVATCLATNKSILLRSGPIAPAVHASSALPNLFAPVELYGHMLIDGGVLEPVPVTSAREFKPKVVIAVNVTPSPLKAPVPKMKYIIERAIDISFSEFSRSEAAGADIVITPEVSRFPTLDDAHNQEIYDLGRKAAIAAIPAIKRELARHGIPLQPKRKAILKSH